MPNVFPMPMSSWPVLKQIIRAYGQVQDRDKPTVDAVAILAQVARPVVSANNNFLREIGIVSKEENKPTPLGSRLASCLVMQNDLLIAEALQQIILANPNLNHWLGMIRARATMKFEHLKGELALAAGISDKGKQTGPARTILEMLQEARLIQVADDNVRPAIPQGSQEKVAEEVRAIRKEFPFFEEPKHAQEPDLLGSRIPLPLGPSRLAYIQLPNDWQPRELKKLVKLLELALGNDEAEA